MAFAPQSSKEGEIDFESLDWEDLPSESRGESGADAIYVEVGRALSTWEQLESVLAIVFSKLCDGRRGESLPLAAGRVYGYVTAGQMRMQMLLEVAEIYSVFVNRDFDLKGLLKLSKHYSKAARSRNNIAHGLVTQWTSADGGNLGFFLGPSMYLSKGNIRVDKWRSSEQAESRPVSPAWKYCYTAKDITHFRVRYEALSAQVSSVLSSLIKWQVEESFRIAERQAAEPITASIVGNSSPTIAGASPAPPSEP